MIRLCYSNRTEELLSALAGDLAAARAAGGGLFEPTPLVVPNPQVETYVKLGVARQNGVAAHLETKYLRGFLAGVVAATAPDVALVERATIEGELLALFHDARRLAAAELGPVRDYLAAGGDAPDALDLRRYQLAAELATLFDEYAFARPELLRAWRGGRTLDGAGAPDAEKRPTEVWQRALWLELFGRGGAFEIRGRALGRRYFDLPGFFADGASHPLQVPRATYIFGISYVARLYRDVLAALGRAGDVFIYALNPCREFWEDLEVGRGGRTRPTDRERFPRRRGGEQLSLLAPSAGTALFSPTPDETPALALWARPGRENIRLLNELSDCNFSPRFSDPLVDGARPTMLAQLQRDILDRVPARSAGGRLALADDSVTVLPCPNPRRELETIAAEIWELMRPGLRFTDVAIIVPPGSAAAYLPLAAAVLREASDLPHTIIDAPAATDSRLLEAVGLLLALPLGPLGRQDLLRLVMHPCVAARFPDADPRDWLALAEELDIVHGGDRDDHAGTYVDGDRFNWDQGLRRLALGAFLAGRRSGDERPFPLDGELYLPEELPPELQASAQGFGLLARALLAFAARARGARQTVAQWMSELRREIATTLVTGSQDDESALTRILGELQRLEAAAPGGLRIGYRIVHELVRAALEAMPARGDRYLTQGVTVSTFLPMRAVPFAAVFVAGMGEGRFPAADRRRALDLRGDSRLPGDVSAREQDNYMFLETLLCARERLYFSYVDRDEVSGERIGPSSTVLDLLDILKDGYLRDGDVRAITRPTPPLERHADDRACAVIPAAARERRAATLARALSALTAGRAVMDWPTLRATLDPSALAALGRAVGWMPAPEAVGAAHRDDGRRIVTIAQLTRFLQCPLQGSARALLPVGNDDAEEVAEAAYREHEDFEVARPRAAPLLRQVLLDAFALDVSCGEDALERAYARVLAVAALDGTFPAGMFGAAARASHRDLLRTWRDGLMTRGAPAAPPSPVWYGQAPEVLRDPPIAPPLLLEIELPRADGPRPVQILLHGTTWPVAMIDGVSTTVIASLSRAKGGNYGRDILGPWLDHVVMSATGRAGSDPRFVVILRPDPDENEAISLLPLPAERARSYLEGLTRQLLERVHDYFLPCEAVLGWRKKSPAPDLTDYIQALRIDNWTKFTSEWGPIPNAKDYPLAPEADARRFVDDRFGPLFASCEELNPRVPIKGKAPARAR